MVFYNAALNNTRTDTKIFPRCEENVGIAKLNAYFYKNIKLNVHTLWYI